MFNAEIRLRKEYMSFDDQTGKPVEMQGIRITLGPKVEKFITLENLTTGRNSNFELLGYTNPNLAQWYANVPVGTEMTLKEYVEQKTAGISDVYDNSEEEDEETSKRRKLHIH